MEAKGEVWQPCWFREENGEWIYNEEYWEDKERGFRPLPDIF